VEPSRTRQTLLAAAHRRFGRIPAELIVEQVLAITRDADWPVREAALEALHRRWDFARRDALVVSSRPPRGSVLGTYATARRQGRGRARDARPYQTLLQSLSPLSGSCDCADFTKGSLGLCKHLLVVLDQLYAKKSRPNPRAPALPGGLHLEWEPLLPLSGELDRVAGLRLSARPPLPTKAARVGRIFSDGVLDAELRRDPARRRAALSTLARWIDGSTTKTRLSTTPAARAVVEQELALVERRLRCGRDAKRVTGELRGLRRKLYPYQREGIARFLESGRLLLADDMGLGKTTQAIAACHALFRAGKVRRGVVVTPASLKSQWLREWQATTGVPAVVIDGTTAERAEHYRALRSGFAIIGYEQLLRDVAQVQALDPEIVVLDEAQRIKNWATKSAVTVKALTPEYRLVLTGTPMENRLEELASILDWVDDLAMAPKWRIVPWYTRSEGDGGGDGSAAGRAGARNLDTLRARLRPSVVRRVRREVIAQLPARTDTRVPVPMTPQQMEAHEELKQPISKLIASARRRPLTQPEFLRLMSLLAQQRIIANGLGQLRFDDVWPAYQHASPDEALLDGLFSPKLVELRRLISDLVVEQDRKVVVFSQWRRMLRLAEWSLRDILGRAGARAVFFTGAEKPAQRTRNVADFHDDPRVRVMFLSDAGGVGLNLQRAANACINLELPWNPAVLEQRVGRIHRLGQKSPIDVFNLVSDASIEARIAGLLGAKQALFSSLFDGSSDEVRFDAAPSFLSRVEQLVELEAPPPPPETRRRAAKGSRAAQAQAPDPEPELDAPDDASDAGAAGAAASHAPDDASDAGAAASDAPVASAFPPSFAGNPSALFDALRIERTASGAVRIEAPPEAAEQLVALFLGMAKLLAASGGARS
jgi:superfamily II DNA or RNA helicase